MTKPERSQSIAAATHAPESSISSRHTSAKVSSVGHVMRNSSKKLLQLRAQLDVG